MRKRMYPNDPKLELYDDDDINANDLTENCPYFIDFVPTQEIVGKLYRRMQQVKDPVFALWAGFYVTQRMDNKIIFESVPIDRQPGDEPFFDYCCDDKAEEKADTFR